MEAACCVTTANDLMTLFGEFGIANFVDQSFLQSEFENIS